MKNKRTLHDQSPNEAKNATARRGTPDKEAGLEVENFSVKQFLIVLLLFLLLVTVGLAANTYKSYFLFGLSLIMMSSVFGYVALHSLRTGVEKSNWGTFYRRRNPIGFWIGVAVWSCASLFLFCSGLAVMLHLMKPANW